MMEHAIRDFARQFSFTPKIQNARNLKKADRFVVSGMGGSQLSAALLSAWDPSLDMIEHRDYGLPRVPETNPKDRLWIFSSYSGNTEEVIDGFGMAQKKKLPMAAIAVGGVLIALCKKYHVPYVQMPDTGIQPRSAVGFSMMGLLALMENPKGLKEARALARTLRPSAFEKHGKALAKKLQGKIPIIYASERNDAVAYNWKIKLNESGKIPAFCNVFPELNHNEMTAYDAPPTRKHLSEHFAFIFLTDSADHPRVQKRMRMTKKLFEDRGFPVHAVPLSGQARLPARQGRMRRMFSSLVLADWTALAIADMYGLESEQIPMVEELKVMMR